MRSEKIKSGFEHTPHCALLKATGVTDADMAKPFIAVVNSYADIVPGHVHLQAFGRLIKQAVRAAGGVPFEFNTIVLNADSNPDYKIRLGEELRQMRDAEMWQAGSVVRSLRPENWKR